MLVADTASYAEAQTCNYKHTARETLHQLDSMRWFFQPA